ncbi:hypothetical protein FSP39_000072 [Pinctada imbricata]|uniref:Reverse transcriptase domain-containing protein n=1 Tax=Pinctada imbricata TaxID=66713 RepID=A0AA88Y0R2_PINIB|nr:hypothetical protein FSP39_000072 [Pinctada imbricata]
MQPNLNNQNKHLSVSPVDPSKLKFWLSGYNLTLKDFLINGFTEGFKIPFTGQREFRISKNLKSATENPLVLQNAIEKEIKTGRAAGPFNSSPFKNFQISPLGVVPKKEKNEFRVIHHLSHPDGNSINDGINSIHTSVQYQTIEDAIRIVAKFGRGTLMAKTDIEHAFKLIPIHPSDYELLGFQFNGQFYYDKTLPFGLSYSCQLFEKFSSALQWIMESHFKVPGCVHVLDDFLYLGPPRSDLCNKSLNYFLNVCKEIGVPIKAAKTVYPTTCLTFLGLEIDSMAFEIRLPPDKLSKLKNAITEALNMRKMTLRQLQSLIGLLNFACIAVTPGRAFLRRIIDLTIGLAKLHFFRRITTDAKDDLRAWALFIENFNGKGLILEDKWKSSETLNLYTDASNLGFGAVFNDQWFYHAWHASWENYHITIKELFPIVLALEVFAAQIANSKIIFHSDNLAVVHIINKQTSKDKTIMKLVRRLVVCILKHNVVFKACHIPGVLNVAADKLSRLQVQQFVQLYPHMARNQVKIQENQLLL